MQLESGIHRLEAPLGERYIAMYLIEGDESCALIDTGLDESVRSTLIPYLQSIGRSPDDIGWIVNTHADFDHVGGNGAAREICPNAQFVCGAADRAQIEDIELMIDDRYGEFRIHGFDETDETKTFIRSVAATVPIDRTVGDGTLIELGGRDLLVLDSPGHSAGHLSLVDSVSGAAIIGDAVLWNSVLTANGAPAFPPTYRDVASYRATIHRLRSLDVPILLTAHYAVARNSAVSEFLEGSIVYTDLVQHSLRDVLSSSANPMSLMEIVRSVGPSLGPWSGEAAQYLVYPLLGHLELLEHDGVVERTVVDGPPMWTMTS
jgi:glyoxylase-like metal-dependent hydrolase (beta-lactamase superfamily II)